MARKNFLYGLIFLTIFFSGASFLAQQKEEYEFYGKHFMVSYKECDKVALTNIPALMEVFKKAVNASHATILNYNFYEFPGNGLTASFLLSESHATIHTYPEHGACFVDLFTCGHTCTWEGFDAILHAYLKPGRSDKEVIIRQ